MNAYELAEKLKHWSGNRDELWESADILIEQAKRIEELEKDIHTLENAIDILVKVSRGEE